MSLLSLSKSLSSLIPKSSNSSQASPKISQKFLTTLQSIPEDPTNINSVKALKKFVYICNYQFKKNNPSMLKIAEKLLENHLKQTKQDKNPQKESIIKLYIITLINHSTSYERSDIRKSMNYLIRALKLSENHKFRSNEGKVLKFIVLIKQSELCIFSQKYENGIACAQQVLNSILVKLVKPKKPDNIKTLAKIAINAFYKIAVCEEARGLRSSADVALDSAEKIRETYLPNQQNLDQLELEMNHKLSNYKRKDKHTCSYVRKTKKKHLTRLKIPRETIFEHFQYSNRSTRWSDMEKPEKLPGRYYSSERLKALDKLISEKRDPILMNTDNYFFTHISRELQISKDITLSPQKVVGQINEHIKALSEARENLKSKKKIFKPEKRDSNKMMKKIEKIQEEFDNHMKIQEVRLKSKLKTRVYQKLMKNINIKFASGKRTPPPQTLFFQKPLVKRRNTAVTQVEQPREVVAEVKKENKAEVFKREIEDQLEEIYKEIHGNNEVKHRESPLEHPGKLAGSAVKPKKVKTQIKSIRRVTLNPNATQSNFFKTEVSFK